MEEKIIELFKNANCMKDYYYIMHHFTLEGIEYYCKAANRMDLFELLVKGGN